MNELSKIEQCVFDFLQRVMRFRHCPHPHILAAVSGGPDSIALLTILHNIAPVVPCSLSVLTVDHNIRPPDESGGDAEFVVSYCKTLNISCRIEPLGKGVVAALATQENGIEDAARRLRYNALTAEARRIGADLIALGHNRNDNIETVVMRFLQGGGAGGLSGIRQERGLFIRPLLTVPRSEIEGYLQHHNLPYRIDKTNNDQTYLRNKIRKSVVPYLDTLVPGWQKSVLSLAAKMQNDEEYIMQCAASIPLNLKNSFDGTAPYVSFCAADTKHCASAVLLRFFQRICTMLDIGKRVPYAHFDRLVEAVKSGRNCDGCGLSLQHSGGYFFAVKDIVQTYKTGYLVSDVCDRFAETRYFAVRYGICPPNGSVFNHANSTLIFVVRDSGVLAVRSGLIDDVLIFENGKSLSLKSFYAKEHIPVFLRAEIPVITLNGMPVCFAGAVFGFHNAADGACTMISGVQAQSECNNVCGRLYVEFTGADNKEIV